MQPMASHELSVMSNKGNLSFLRALCASARVSSSPCLDRKKCQKWALTPAPISSAEGGMEMKCEEQELTRLRLRREMVSCSTTGVELS
jgi:hypothetical protein